ncbi:MAG: hypothetical protein NC418_09385 [Muribaculaceae bacterium]|nr:hypothetical protein [Muribaculaceae bacterium]
MTFPALAIITLILALAAVAAMFVPRLPVVLAAYAALVCSHFAGAVYVDAKILIFWGVAALIVLGLRLLAPRALMAAVKAQRYVALGTLCGVVLGYMLSPTAAAIIASGAVCAALGGMAYMLTPGSPRVSPASAAFLEFLCAKGLPCVVTASMATIALASLL